MTSLGRGIEILKYIIVNRCASVSEIARVFGIDKSTASRTLAVLAEHNLVSKEEVTMKYYPGIATLLYSSRTVVAYQILDAVHPILTALADAIDMTAQVCVRKDDRVYLIDQVKSRGNRYLKEPALPGMPEPLHCSAIGKCILAWLPSESYNALMEQYELKRYTDATITQRSVLDAEMERIRRDGYAIDCEEFNPNLFCVAVPVVDQSGSIIFSLGISGGWNFLENKTLFDTVLKAAKKAAAQIGSKYEATEPL